MNSMHPGSVVPRQLHRGFTLTELLVVLLIIAVLAGIGVAVVRSGMDSAKQSGCLANLRQIGVALEVYSQEHGQRMPVMEAGRRSRSEEVPVMDTVLVDYVESEDVFRCPADPEEWEKSGSSYLWNSILSGSLKNQLSFFGTDDPGRIPMVIDKEAWHPKTNEGTNFLYANLSASNRIRFVTSP